ncbi:MAG TPA: ChaN family lipoprotein [Acidobacteriota bacterium]|nr:ChaN family lipoprotein [Acidobacteriota bacterium]
MCGKKLWVLFLFISICVVGLADEEKDQTLQLRIGNPSYKEKSLVIEPGKIYSAKKGKSVSFEEMIQEMKEARFVYVGETHNSLPMHEIQFQITEALYKQDPKLCIGLEMFDIHWQEELNKWSIGLLTQDEFIDQAKWYENWNFNFNYYRKIFELAKKYKIPMYALNAPREIIHKIRMMGWSTLSNEEKEIVPEPGLSNKDHRALMKTVFSRVDMPEAMKGREQMMFKGLYRAQSAWDEVMAKNTLKAAEVEDSRVMILAGSGHLLYNLGINRRVYERRSLPYKSVICVNVPKGEKSIEVSRSLADFVYGLTDEERPVYPSSGIALKKVEGLDNLVIERDPISGAAKGQNFKKGDIILSVDGKRYTSINDLRKYLSQFHWGDEVCFKLLREANEIEIKLIFKDSDAH